MIVIALLVGALLGLVLIVAGASKKKVLLSVLVATISVLVLGFLALLFLVNSPLWTM